jgi:hypothetical protein
MFENVNYHLKEATKNFEKKKEWYLLILQILSLIYKESLNINYSFK